MNLILVRHTEAAKLGEDGTTTDADRLLTELGRTHAAKLAQLFSARGLVPGAVVTSGLVRATQTAEPLAQLLAGESKELAVCGHLAPDQYRPKKLTRFVLGLDQQSVVLVGHNPDLSAYLAWLVGAENSAFDLAKGAAALVEFDGEPEKGEGRLRWLVTPEWYAPVSREAQPSAEEKTERG